MHKALLLLAALLAGCGGGDAPVRSATASAPVTVIAAGDSITQRTGLCSPGLSVLQCGADETIASQSWVTYLPDATAGALLLIANEGRGGDTCTPQAPWASGIHAGQGRGLIDRLAPIIAARPSLVLLLIGINDVALYAVTPADVARCVADARSQLQAAGIAVVVLTYPPIMPGTPVYAGIADAPQRVAALNAALRSIGAADTAGAWPAWAARWYTADGVHSTPAGAVQLALRAAAAVGAR